MGSTDKIITLMKRSPNGVRFNDLLKVCEQYFGKPRITGSHHSFKKPWRGDPIVNIQKLKGGKAKGYQVKQVLAAIEKKENAND